MWLMLTGHTTDLEECAQVIVCLGQNAKETGQPSCVFE